MDLPWSRINDYLVEVGSVTNLKEFGYRVLAGLADLIPCDNNGVFVVSNPTGLIVQASLSDSPKWRERYNNYYWQLMPNPTDSKTSITDWRDYSNTEYVADFIHPQGIATAITTCHLGAGKGYPGALELYRSIGSSGFNEQDMQILNIVQPHLSNYFAIHSLLAVYDSQLPDASIIASDWKCLTQREAEIAALLCRRFSTSMIGSKLLISNPTVYRHIANIFEKLSVFNRDELREKLLSGYFGKVGACTPRKENAPP